MKTYDRIAAIFCLLFFLTLFRPSFSYPVTCIPGRLLFNIAPGADQPSDLANAPNGDIYLVDGVNQRVIVTDAKGEWKFAFGKQGNGKGEFAYPLGIDIAEDGKVFIADSGNHRIQVFDLKGDFLYGFPVAAGPGEKPSDPVDVLASRLKGYLYVSDNENHKIKVYNRQGVMQFEWGKFGEESGEFRYPGILAVNAYNEIFVVDILNTRIQRFDPFGNYIATIGGWGVLPGKFFRPKGVAVDADNTVYVSDSYMGLVQVFTELGRFRGILCEANRKKQFMTPVGLGIDAKNHRLQVVEMRANRISVWQLK